MTVNNITVSGNIGKEPELKEFASGAKKVTFSVAVSENAKTQEGAWENKTMWLNIEFWNKDAEFLSKYATKGSFIVVTGKLAEDTWETNGETKRKMYVKGFGFHLPRDKSANKEEFSSSFSDDKSSKVEPLITYDNVPF